MCPTMFPRILASVHLALEAQNVEDKLNISNTFAGLLRGSEGVTATSSQWTRRPSSLTTGSPPSSRPWTTSGPSR